MVNTDIAPGRPRRADATRNRAALVAAARRVFERDGYVRARITDIADEAGVAHGSFYSHFDGKRGIFAAVMAEVEEEMLHPGPALTAGGADPVAVIAAANLAYLEAYRRNAPAHGAARAGGHGRRGLPRAAAAAHRGVPGP